MLILEKNRRGDQDIKNLQELKANSTKICMNHKTPQIAKAIKNICEVSHFLVLGYI